MIPSGAGGQPGTQTAGGSASVPDATTGSPGQLGIGGSAAAASAGGAGGGGGGGFYGGEAGGVSGGGGGGGSSLVPTGGTVAIDTVGIPKIAISYVVPATVPPPPTNPGGGAGGKPAVSFAGTPASFRISSRGTVPYAFLATPGLSGVVTLTAAKALKIAGHKRTLKLSRSFTAPANAVVKLSFRISAATRRALIHAHSTRFNVRVAAGGTFTSHVTITAHS
jgi:hypothetical protein